MKRQARQPHGAQDAGRRSTSDELADAIRSRSFIPELTVLEFEDGRARFRSAVVGEQQRSRSRQSTSTEVADAIGSRSFIPELTALEFEDGRARFRAAIAGERQRSRSRQSTG